MNKKQLLRYTYLIAEWITVCPFLILVLVLSEIYNSTTFNISFYVAAIVIYIFSVLKLPKFFDKKRHYFIMGIIWFVLINIFALLYYISIGKGFSDLIPLYSMRGTNWGIIPISALLIPFITPYVKKYYE